MARIVRLTESELVRLVKKVIKEQTSTPLANLITNAGFVSGVDNLTRQQNANEGPLGGIVANYVRQNNIPETNVFSKKENGLSVIIINGNKVLFLLRNYKFKYGELSFGGDKRTQIGTRIQTVQGAGGPQEQEKPVYLFYDDAEKFRIKLETVTVDPEIIKTRKILPLMDKAFTDKGYVKGINNVPFVAKTAVNKELYKVKDKNNIYIAIEGQKTPIAIIEKIDDYNYNIIMDSYKIYTTSVPMKIKTSELYQKLIS